MPRLNALALALLIPLLPAAGLATAQTPAAMPAATPPALDAATANNVATVDGPSGLLRLQVLLDRARFSPGQIDGQPGSNQQRALRGYQAAHGLPVTGEPDAATWQALNADQTAVVADYTLTAEDLAGPFVQIPKDIAKQAGLKSLGYTSLAEALGERFHVYPQTLQQLNPGVDFAQAKAGTVIKVTNIGGLPPLPKAAKVVVDKSDSTLSLLDAQGKVLAQFPVTSGSQHDPLPLGEWKILGAYRDPTFHYNPKLFWDAKKGDKKATIAAGPNNPVGRVWIDLSKEHYGLHGTAEPRSVGKSQSHGCVRLTNWDVLIVADAVDTSVPVLFQE
ncbi:L,D-transpeptidase [Pseudoxanthomonas sp. GM95]|uniref:L,D-transpeptidase family protein n=1 Tax=Pseudoxanthomonas sp. GM95 TaxID=1881043 RepID=UPI000B86539A|nr:L,D-transpeptidase [Pseudoxanthomonas sp. GM95]